ncbi:hypothetical protein GOP47_0007819 [Adiantum capillus-veneris]|uniref:Uncharacterized protein n=1 Tax=Adiantum capillus-veneris TaxID=13818 RepID=A0A9D4ZMC7_ADICA|nr:hypothetical protein GOP47_0007819 [Adiantum capillus-veneris]
MFEENKLFLEAYPALLDARDKRHLFDCMTADHVLPYSLISHSIHTNLHQYVSLVLAVFQSHKELRLLASPPMVGALDPFIYLREREPHQLQEQMILAIYCEM